MPHVTCLKLALARSAPITALVILLVTLLIALPAAAQDPTPTPTPEKDAPDYLLAWPVPYPTEDQLAEAAQCELETLPDERYPDSLEMDVFADAFDPETACDWAVLAVAYAHRAHDKDIALPDAGIDAFAQAVSQNPALALRADLMSCYFGKIPLVEPPPLADRTITAMDLHYDYNGIGGGPNSWVDYTVTITNANTEPVMDGVIKDTPWDEEAEDREISGTVDAALIQALSPALSDMLPIETPFGMLICYDNYSDWTVTLTFDDGSTIELATHDSNFLYVGGPWQAVIEDQHYLQFSAKFIARLVEVIDALELPWGETAAMTCAWHGDPFYSAYPSAVAE